MTHDPDERLVVRMAARDERALIELHRRYSPYLLALGRRMLRNADERQEVVEEAFVSAWKAAARFDPAKARARTWLMTLAHRLMVNRLRGERLEMVPFEAWNTPVRPMGGAGGGHAEPASRPAAELAQDERELVELAFYQSHSYQELADLTGRPLGTVKSKLRRALGRLSGLLGGEPDGEPRGGEVAGDR